MNTVEIENFDDLLKTNLKLAKNNNLWTICYNQNDSHCAFRTIFNSGMIDEEELVKHFFLKKNPRAINIVIKHEDN